MCKAKGIFMMMNYYLHTIATRYGRIQRIWKLKIKHNCSLQVFSIVFNLTLYLLYIAKHVSL